MELAFNPKVFIVLAVLCILTGVALPNPESTESKRLIRVNEIEEPKWLTQQQIFDLIGNETTFMDVTNRGSQKPAPHALQNLLVLPEEVQYRAIVEEIYGKLNISRVENFLIKFTSFHNRYYNVASGAEAAEWLYNQIVEIHSQSSYKGRVSFEYFDHPSWLQKSVIARLIGSNETLETEIVILGAHLDSLNANGGATGRSPGADDNASGSSVLFETLTAILESDFLPQRTIEFQWYAAEEQGLLGSGEIAKSYLEQNINVVSMLNFDIVGYYENVNSIAFNVDLTDPLLTNFLKTVADSYLEFTRIDRTCGYACSDYYSWHQYGYSVAYVKQAVRNPYMHTAQDSIEIVSFVQIMEFVKLAVGYAIEIAEPYVI